MSDLNIFNKESSEFYCISFVDLFISENKSHHKGQYKPFGKSLEMFVCFILYLLVTFSYLYI